MVGDFLYYVWVIFGIGWIQWILGVIIKISCLVDVIYFFFDKQVCDIIFINWGYIELEMNLYFRDEVIDLSLFM